jgi:hypothetical protein
VQQSHSTVYTDSFYVGLIEGMEAPDAMDSSTRTGYALVEMDSWKQRAQLRSERLQAFNGRRPPRLR